MFLIENSYALPFLQPILIDYLITLLEDNDVNIEGIPECEEVVDDNDRL